MYRSELITSGERWMAFAESVAGRSHIAANRPNQDAVSLWPAPGATSSAIILAISDGHGGERYCRSEHGAHFAAEEAAAGLREFVETVHASGVPASATLVDVALQRTCRRILGQWRERVVEDVVRHPLSETEREHASDNAAMLYGATLVACVIGDGYQCFLRVGDGDILSLDLDGNVRDVFGRDASSVANETSSVAQCVAPIDPLGGTTTLGLAPNALRSVRHLFELRDMAPLKAILASTDGYSNSFASASGFHQALLDFSALATTAEGRVSLERNLSTWLTETSAEGSGDDVTLGLVVRLTE